MRGSFRSKSIFFAQTFLPSQFKGKGKRLVCKARRPRYMYEFTTVVFCGDSKNRWLKVFLVS